MRKNNNLPLVTVITPTYNRASFLDETILSVITQDYPNMEYIVLDDGSTDNTFEIIKKYQDKLRWYTHENMGETKTVNKGFSMAKGEIITVVNSDDPILPGAIKEAVAEIEKHPEVLAIYFDWNEIGPNSEIIKEVQLPEYNIFNMLTEFNAALGPGVFIRRKVLDLIGMRDERLKFTGDLEYWFRVALHGKMVHISKALVTHRAHPGAASVSEKSTIMAEELISLVKKIYAHPKLPLVVFKQRNKVFSAAHYTAASYCCSNKVAAIKHYYNSLQYDPLYFIRQWYFRWEMLFYNFWKKLKLTELVFCIWILVCVFIWGVLNIYPAFRHRMPSSIQYVLDKSQSCIQPYVWKQYIYAE